MTERQIINHEDNDKFVGYSASDLLERTEDLLAALGMDRERCNDRSAMTFLALADVRPGTDWTTATNRMYTTRQIMDWIRDQMGVAYAANTREAIRRFTLHQFIAGGIVQYNADDPNRPTNSPWNNYRIAPPLLPVIRAIDTPEYPAMLAEFLSGIKTWNQQVAEEREMNRVPVRMPDGSNMTLSAGGQNVLIKQMVEEFCPRFVPGGIVLYIDDTDKALGSVVDVILQALNIEIPEHGKAPDLIVWDKEHNWVFMMEACSTHGPVDVMRKRELRSLFDGIRAPMVFVSCFPDRNVMGKYLADLAWETEAWCADTPGHMVHPDGMRFLGPYEG